MFFGLNRSSKLSLDRNSGDILTCAIWAAIRIPPIGIRYTRGVAQAFSNTKLLAVIPATLKAMAITAQRIYSSFRPGGVKVHAGAPVIEQGMREEDFADLAKAGVKLLGEIGLGGVKDGPTGRKMVEWARTNLGLEIDGALLTGITADQARDLLWNAFDARYR